jgi:hypothetical protein
LDAFEDAHVGEADFLGKGQRMYSQQAKQRLNVLSCVTQSTISQLSQTHLDELELGMLG